ncbi:hypothetical protein [uncultured Nostoc sp.]
MKEQFASVFFEDKSKKLLEPDWQNKKRKYKRVMPSKKDHNNTAA